MIRHCAPNANALSAIANYRVVDELISTSGQPTLLQLFSVAAAGFSTVSNLGVDHDPRFASGNERTAVELLGRSYVHIPVAFAAPTERDLLQFFAQLDARREEKVWIHCATNKRVSAFLCLYRIIRLGMERDHAFAQMLEVWAPNEVWSSFIAAMLAKHTATAPSESPPSRFDDCSHACTLQHGAREPDRSLSADNHPRARTGRSASALLRRRVRAPLITRSIPPARAWAVAMLTLLPHTGLAQSVAQRTPNLANGWTPIRGVVQLNFTHRFDVSDAPLRKITNTPSFQVATGVAGPLAVGFTYGSNSDLVPAYPNEWEWFARWSPLSQEGVAPLDASLQAGWNVAAESFDAELSTARQFGPLRVLVAGRAFHHAFYEDSARYAVAGGASLRLLRWLTIAGDYATLIDRAESERPVWGAGLQLSVPTTPHSISIHAGNVGTGSLEGASRGSHTRWGFEYTVPITLRRYASRRTPPRTVAVRKSQESSGGPAARPSRDPDTVIVTIRNFRFVRDKITVKSGDVIVWRNADQVEHTVLADTGAFESPVIEPGRDWTHHVTTPGTYIYHCKPHPFMKAQIRVREVKP